MYHEPVCLWLDDTKDNESVLDMEGDDERETDQLEYHTERQWENEINAEDDTADVPDVCQTGSTVGEEAIPLPGSVDIPDESE